MQNNDRSVRIHELSDRQRKELDCIEAEILATLGAAQPDYTSSSCAQALDREAINNEHAFIRRFGFDWPRSDRIGVITLKHRLDLTDREIRLLKLTGNLKRQHGMVTLASTRWAAIFGRCLATFTLFEFALVILLEMITVHHPLSALQVAQLFGVTAFVLAMVWLVHLGYIKPWIIEQRVTKNVTPNAP